MRVTTNLLRSLAVGQDVLIDETHSDKGQGDLSYLFSRMRPLRFKQKRYLLVDPENLTVQKVWRVTRIEDWHD